MFTTLVALIKFAWAYPGIAIAIVLAAYGAYYAGVRRWRRSQAIKQYRRYVTPSPGSLPPTVASLALTVQ